MIEGDHVKMRIVDIVALLVMNSCNVSSQTFGQCVTEGANQRISLRRVRFDWQSHAKPLAYASLFLLRFILSSFSDLNIQSGTNTLANNGPSRLWSGNIAQVRCGLPDKCLAGILLPF